MVSHEWTDYSVRYETLILQTFSWQRYVPYVNDLRIMNLWTGGCLKLCSKCKKCMKQEKHNKYKYLKC